MNKKLNVTLFFLSACIFTSFAELERGLTPDFMAFLNDNGYGSYGYDRSDLEGGSFGGKASKDEVLTHDPVIFIHGNSDIAVGLNYW